VGAPRFARSLETMMSDLRSILERGVGDIEPLPDGYQRLLRRNERKRRDQRITAGVLGVSIALAILLAGVSILRSGPVPADLTPSPVGVGGADDFVIDIETGAATPLPASLAITPAGDVGDYQVSPDGRMLLFDGRDSEAWCRTTSYGCDHLSQIYVANTDGTGIRRLTEEPEGAVAGSWSPDGTKIAYVVGWGERPTADLYVMDVGTGTETKVASGLPQNFKQFPVPRFSPDGQAVLFTGGNVDLRRVPVEGGPSRLVHPHAAWGSYSPDGSTIAFMHTVFGCCVDSKGSREGTNYLRRLSLADPNGSHVRVLVEGSFERAIWSPDGTRIVVEQANVRRVFVVDVATGRMTRIGEGTRPTWLDDRTLIVEEFRR
jgi:dipeptidyl aminopeptidase/acylaminoacyl peptidase